MNNELRESSQDLLACFFSECESQFDFLAEKHGYHMISGMADYRHGRQVIIPYKGESVTGNFQAVFRFEKDDQSLEILYGDKEFVVESYAYFNRIYRLGLGEVLSAAKKNDSDLGRNWLVIRNELMRQTIGDMAQALRKHKKHFLHPNPKIIDRALTMRSKRMEQAIRAQYRKDIQNAGLHAAKAFMEQDYKKVVEIFTPYERDLSPGDAKKLDLARRNLLGKAS